LSKLNHVGSVQLRRSVGTLTNNTLVIVNVRSRDPIVYSMLKLSLRRQQLVSCKRLGNQFFYMININLSL